MVLHEPVHVDCLANGHNDFYEADKRYGAKQTNQ